MGLDFNWPLSVKIFPVHKGLCIMHCCQIRLMKKLMCGHPIPFFVVIIMRLDLKNILQISVYRTIPAGTSRFTLNSMLTHSLYLYY